MSDGKGGKLSVLSFGLLAASLIFIWWAFTPGHTNGDTIGMFQQAQSGKITDWNGPLVSVLWSLCGAPVWIVSLTFFLCMGAFGFFTYHIIVSAGLSPARAAALTTLTAFTPPVLGLLGCSCKDTWVAVLFLGMLHFYILGAVRRRFVFVAIRNLLGIAAALIRPEFILIVCLFLVFDFLLVSPRHTTSLSLRVRDLALNGFAVVVGYAALGSLLKNLAHVEPTHPEQFIFLSDLVDLSVAENRMLIPGPFIQHTNLETIKKYYEPPDVTPAFWGGPDEDMVNFSMRPEDIVNLKAEWRRDVLANPVEAIKHRASLFESYLRGGNYYMSEMSPNDSGLKMYHPGLEALLLDYLKLFIHSPWQRHFLPFLGSPILIYILLRYDPANVARRCLAVALLCGIAYQLLFSAVGLAPYWRFAYAGVVVFWIVFYIVVTDWILHLFRPKTAQA